MSNEFTKIRNLFHHNWDLVEEAMRATIVVNWSTRGRTTGADNFSLYSQQVYADFYNWCQDKDVQKLDAFIRMHHKYFPQPLVKHVLRLMIKAINIKEK